MSDIAPNEVRLAYFESRCERESGGRGTAFDAGFRAGLAAAHPVPEDADRKAIIDVLVAALSPSSGDAA